MKDFNVHIEDHQYQNIVHNNGYRHHDSDHNDKNDDN